MCRLVFLPGQFYTQPQEASTLAQGQIAPKEIFDTAQWLAAQILLIGDVPEFGTLGTIVNSKGICAREYSNPNR